MEPILKLFNLVLSQLTTLVKKSLHKFNFLALSTFDGLLSLLPHWDDLLSRRGSDVSDKNEPRDGVQSLRTSCLRSFPEFLADNKMGAMARGSDIMRFSSSLFNISWRSGGVIPRRMLLVVMDCKSGDTSNWAAVSWLLAE